MAVAESPLTVASADGDDNQIQIYPQRDGIAFVVLRTIWGTTSAVRVDVRELLRVCGRALDVVHKMEDGKDKASGEG